MVATTAHTLGCSVSLCPIDPPLTPLFLLMKSRLTKSAEAHIEGLTMVAGFGALPIYNCILWSQKRENTESGPPWKCSSVRKRKKNAIYTRSVIDCCLRDPSCVVTMIQ